MDHTEQIVSQNYFAELEDINTKYQDMRHDTIPLADNLQNSPAVTSYLNYKNKGNRKEIIVDAFSAITDFANSTPYVHSIYLYNNNLGYLSDSYGYEGMNCQSDANLHEYLFDNTKNQLFLNTRTETFLSKVDKLGLTVAHTSNVFTLLRKGDSNKSGFIVNLSEEKLRETIVSTKDRSLDKNFYIIDGNNVFVSSADTSEIGTDAASDSLFGTILSREDEKGFQKIYDRQGNPYLGCWVKQPEMDWTLIYMIPYYKLTDVYQNLEKNIYLIMALILVCALVILFVLAHNMEKALDRSKRLQAFLEGKSLIPSEYANSNSLYSLCHIRLHGTKEVSIAQEKIVYYIERKLSHSAYSATSSKDYFIIVSKNSTEQLTEEITRLETFFNEKGIAMLALVSAESYEIEYIPDISQKIADEMTIQYLTRTSGIQKASKECLAVPKSKNIDLSRLDSAIMHCNSNDYRNAVDCIVKQILNIQNVELLKSEFVLIATEIINLLRDELDAHYTGGAANYFTTLIENEQIDVLKETLMAIAPLLDEMKKNEGGMKGSEIATHMMDYIKENIANKSLNSAMIAEQFNLSINYTRVLFKKHTGLSVNEYLGKLRIEKAGALLADTSMNVKDISDKVGFSNYSYFCTYFKNHWNVSPSQYRQNHILAQMAVETDHD
jgi:AraC-like DNA-binding protein